MSLSIAEHINKTLSASGKLVSKIGNRLYPVSVKSEVDLPFIVYERESIQPKSSKDGMFGDNVTVNVYVFAEAYKDAVDIAEMVRDALDGSSGKYASFVVDECDFADAAESCDEGIYLEQLVFNITTL